MIQVLLVEPDRLLAKTYSKALRASGYKVIIASNSQEAINKADKNKPNIIVLELQLVGHSGIEFLYEFRSYPDWQEVPVLINTLLPYIEIQDSWQLLKEVLGVSVYTYKPATSLDNLVNSLSQLVKSS